ncbi:MAG TPA: hypothetical protein VEA18_00100 [Candidatus Kapabacteria bacterium]|nr:hypothetical protein [Candidatus Kapabacteria bacterium]
MPINIRTRECAEVAHTLHRLLFGEESTENLELVVLFMLASQAQGDQVERFILRIPTKEEKYLRSFVAGALACIIYKDLHIQEISIETYRVTGRFKELMQQYLPILGRLKELEFRKAVSSAAEQLRRNRGRNGKTPDPDVSAVVK